MIYLKFCTTQNASPIQERVYCVTDYAVAHTDAGTQVHFKPGLWEMVSPNDWLNLYVMSETGKTIDKIEA